MIGIQKSTDVGFFLSKDSKPHCGKAAPIQKGLIPSRKGIKADLCEEGVGFGVPILKYRRDFYFPGSAKTSVQGEVVKEKSWKKFDLNLIDRHQKGVSSKPETFSWVYQRLYNRVYKSAMGRKIIDLSGRFTGAVGVQVEGYTPSFYQVPSKGTITVHYQFVRNRNEIRISMEFESIEREGLQEIFVSNELGGVVFDSYVDNSGLGLKGNEISGWDRIRASRAAFYSANANLFFEVDIPEQTVAFRGREIIGDLIRWSGVILSLPPSANEVEYSVSIGPLSELEGMQR